MRASPRLVLPDVLLVFYFKALSVAVSLKSISEMLKTSDDVESLEK